MPLRRPYPSLGLWVCLLAAPVMAAEPLDLSAPPPAVRGQIEQVRRDLDDGKTYVEIGSEQRGTVLAALQRIDAAVSASPDTQLSRAEQVRLSDDQALVNEILTKARDDSRLICRREAKVGSNMLASQCMTAAERRRVQDRGKQGLDDLRSRTPTKVL